MKNGKLVVYWDADIYITILEGDKSDQDLYEGCIYAKDRVERKECFLIASQLINLEVKQTTIPTNIAEKFENVMKRSNVTQVSMGNRISNLASELIEICSKMERVLKSPDSIHLATALIYEVDEFYTNDDKLLKLNGILTVPKHKVPPITNPPLEKQLKLDMN